MTDPHYTPLGEGAPVVACGSCAATVAVTSWWQHIQWHRELVDVQRVVAAEAALDAFTRADDHMNQGTAP